ncbi:MULTISPECIES: undecaprenyl-phosphate glucose phosphotransferase [unclassified Rhizobium]|uniref:undecaprenyl-phosphate glucose phosphotransferase n=1 Tax=unclassified Rhizobium TaxID=2613769 RepID=UPI001610202D|nr:MULTISPECIES: undecaprenyl-phosphate glucose phosphotransferase [unclassified Rhizobium]MBB3319105.1 putative colanic acid biosynthesis UDP-glucose lipid carrier transferase [Rhizobium sp. BK181]MBB3544191.1 putative colanic acid biosynthesis UDP-glucose lipid carrier transferase [Rhizobium sp. BK399]
MTIPVEYNWSPNHSVRSDRKWLGFNAIAISCIAASCDFVALIGASAAGHLLYQQIGTGTAADMSLYVGVGLFVATVFVLAMFGVHGYRPREILSFRRQLLMILTLLPAAILLFIAVALFLKVGTTMSRGSLITTAGLSVAGLVALRLCWRQVGDAFSRAQFPSRTVLLICPGSMQVEPVIQRATQSGLSVNHIMKIAENDLSLGWMGEVYQEHGIDDVDEVLVAWSDYGNLRALEKCLSDLRQFCVPVSVMFGGVVGEVVEGFAQTVGERRAFQIHRPPLDFYQRALKRAFDILFSIAALFVMFPICLMVAIAVKLDSPGPIFFAQSRKGYNGRAFRILKFRSMTVLEDGGNVRQATRNDPRVTRVGGFIRSTSLDELPQFWNVLRGDMSVVGPRPHAMAHDDLYGTLIAQYATRRNVKPGLTGWAQISGCRGETPTLDRMADRVQHDLWYINNWSFWLDVKIVLLTMRTMLDRSNVY